MTALVPGLSVLPKAERYSDTVGMSAVLRNQHHMSLKRK